MIFLKLGIWLIVPLFNAWMDRKGAKRNYLVVNILRGMAAILHGSLFIHTYEGYWYYWWPVLMYQFTSFWIVFELVLNRYLGRGPLYYDQKEGDSGIIDRFFKWAGTGWHTVAKVVAMLLMIYSIALTYFRHT